MSKLEVEVVAAAAPEVGVIVEAPLTVGIVEEVVPSVAVQSTTVEVSGSGWSVVNVDVREAWADATEKPPSYAIFLF